MGLKAIVKNIPEYKQPQVIGSLIKKYNPDIVVITGHDGMIRNSGNYNDIYNYRNSRYFIKSVVEARKKANPNKDLVIFAGACQSFFEAIMASRSKLCLFSCKSFNRFHGPNYSCRKGSINR